jgi:hypothetical protein
VITSLEWRQPAWLSLLSLSAVPSATIWRRTIGFERRATIAFRVEKNTVRIIRIFYAGRDFDAYFRDLDLDEDD